MFEIVLVIICLFFNAILSCIEMAFVTVSRHSLKKSASNGDVQASRILALKSNPERVLSILQIGITLVGAISAAVGGAGAEEHLSPILETRFQFTEEMAEVISIVLIVIPISFLSVVVGELVPKTLAIKFPMRFAKMGSGLLIFLSKIFSPIVVLLEISTKLISTLFIRRLGSESLAETAGSIEIDNLSDTHKQYVLNLIEVDKRKVKDILVPWESVEKVNSNDHVHLVMNLIKNSGHTRIPVLDNGEPIGIIHSKEFISESEIALIDWLQLARPVVFLSSDEPILNALKILQSRRNHMAIIVANKKPIGIVTLEDIFEEVVGEIYDEIEDPNVLLASNSRIRTMQGFSTKN